MSVVGLRKVSSVGAFEPNAQKTTSVSFSFELTFFPSSAHSQVDSDLLPSRDHHLLHALHLCGPSKLLFVSSSLVCWGCGEGRIEEERMELDSEVDGGVLSFRERDGSLNFTETDEAEGADGW